jgi:hypothetical protein
VNQSRFAEEMTDYAYYKAPPLGEEIPPKKIKLPLDKWLKM